MGSICLWLNVQPAHRGEIGTANNDTFSFYSEDICIAGRIELSNYV